MTAALEVFHARGYKGASTEILVRELGVNRNSVYAEFGSKEGLFGAVLDRYRETMVQALFGPLESPGASLDEIEALLHVFSASAEAASGFGCLLCNTAAELGGTDSGLQPRVEAYFERLHGAFANALAGAKRAGQVEPALDTDTEAALLYACCVGIFLTVRARVDVARTQGAVQGALKYLQRLRTGTAVRLKA